MLWCCLSPAPTVTSIEPDQLPVSGGHIVIHGSNFGADASHLSAGLSFHELQFSDFEMVTPHTAVKCFVPGMPSTLTCGVPVEVSLAVDEVYSKSIARINFSALMPAEACVLTLLCMCALAPCKVIGRLTERLVGWLVCIPVMSSASVVESPSARRFQLYSGIFSVDAAPALPSTGQHSGCYPP
jgi:hypothetical protein